MTTGFGWPNSTGRMTTGTMLVLNMLCSASPGNAESTCPKAESKPSAPKTSCSSNGLTGKRRRRATRARMMSGLTVLRSDETNEARERWSYILLVEEMRRIVAEADKDARELFRRICFNALISNLDDHPRNHALLARHVDWALSPAYDLTPSPVVSLDRRDLALVCGDQGRFANAKNILSQHARFLLQKDEAEKIIADTKAQVGHWYDTVRACGVSEKDAETIRGAFIYPGFSY